MRSVFASQVGAGRARARSCPSARGGARGRAAPEAAPFEALAEAPSAVRATKRNGSGAATQLQPLPQLGGRFGDERGLVEAARGGGAAASRVEPPPGGRQGGEPPMAASPQRASCALTGSGRAGERQRRGSGVSAGGNGEPGPARGGRYGCRRSPPRRQADPSAAAARATARVRSSSSGWPGEGRAAEVGPDRAVAAILDPRREAFGDLRRVPPGPRAPSASRPRATRLRGGRGPGEGQPTHPALAGPAAGRDDPPGLTTATASWRSSGSLRSARRAERAARRGRRGGHPLPQEAARRAGGPSPGSQLAWHLPAGRRQLGWHLPGHLPAGRRAGGAPGRRPVPAPRGGSVRGSARRSGRRAGAGRASGRRAPRCAAPRRPRRRSPGGERRRRGWYRRFGRCGRAAARWPHRPPPPGAGRRPGRARRAASRRRARSRWRRGPPGGSRSGSRGGGGERSPPPARRPARGRQPRRPAPPLRHGR